MERRGKVQERRTASGLKMLAERRLKSRRRARKLVGSPPPSRSRIDVSEDDELRYWTKELGVSADELKSAVQKVGPMAKDVREHLGK